MTSTTGNVGVAVGGGGASGNLTIQNGSTLSSTGATFQIGQNVGNTGIVTVTGAGSRWNLSGSQLVVGVAGNGTLNVENGATVVAQGGIRLANNAGSSATLNVRSGGVLETTGINLGSGTRQINFDNATVRALAISSAFLGSAGNQTNIAAGGLTVDTNGFTVRALGLSGVGGLTKIGAGTFTLGAASTYTGETVIQQGTLALAGPAASANDALANSSRVVANATFDISAIAGAGSHIKSLAGSGMVTLGAKNLIITNANDTFAGSINGTGGLTLTSGTQTLSGANAYSGATTVTGGTLQIGNGGTSGSIIGNVTNNGTFAFNRADRLDFAGTVTGSGLIRQIGSGLTNLSGDNSAFTGTTSVEAGTLAVNGNLGGTLSVLSAGRLQGIGTVGTTTNAGVIAPGNSIGTLTVAGNYTGNGGALELETVLGGDASATDRLVVTGNTAGSTTVRVLNRGGAGAQTANGIKVIDVAGASNGIFALQGDYVLQGQQAMVAGAYAYTLQKNGVSTPTDGDWYLRSSLINPPAAPSGGTPAPAGPLYQPGVPLYENYGQVLLSMNQAPSLQQRVGNRYWGGSEAMARAGINKAQATDGSWTQSAFWGRIEGGQAELRPSNTTGSTYSSDEMKAQTGLDGIALDNDRGR
ncbi:autotransporter outer membrane beta-barrel domain-containing protein [Bradyrhizobium sp. Ai1a-2]|uniref:autotransporter outer membrane beta-barrel domain-containing protein n=1 Tax=Bradyrhizobium sp. Ai1a-2 TaxID=196490 RepID=UPI0013633B7D|nr:autotransporter outer membrane beta-barrel domain-containing protein [Bradyrhizobium sp. Ai1a-2]